MPQLWSNPVAAGMERVNSLPPGKFFILLLSSAGSHAKSNSSNMHMQLTSGAIMLNDYGPIE